LPRVRLIEILRHVQSSNLGRAFGYLRPHSRRVFTISGLTLASAAVQVLEPLAIKGIIDQLTQGGRMSALVPSLLALTGLLLSRELLGCISNWLTWRARLGIHFDLLDASVERLHSLPLSYHRDQAVGAMMTRLDRGVQGFLNATTEVAFQVLPAVVYLLCAVAIMFSLDWRLALLVLAFAPLPALIAIRAGSEQAERERGLLDLWSKIYSRFNEVLSGIVTVRSFAMEDDEKRRFLSGVGVANGRVLRGVATDARWSGLQGVSVSVARVSAIALGGSLVLAGYCSIGTLVAFLAYLNGLFGPVQGLTGMYGALQRASASIGHVYAILDAQDHVADAPDARALETLGGAVRFDRVWFGYDASRPPVLRDINLDVAPGERIALVGPSGSGKSTLIALLQRFHDPLSGSIQVDGVDLRQLAQKSFRRQIGVVLQDAVLFDDSVRANIAYGRPEASLTQIVEAARAAHAHDFILRLPRGYDTPVGERGKLLSGGERQRIAIARALLKDPPLLILDEATSALDSESEQLVQGAIDRVTHGRTSFVIAHRLSTVINAHRIIVLRDGEVHEVGTHAELLEKNGYYALLVRQQLLGLAEPVAPRAA
jgi:ATP-binding cassette subfamily B protein